MRYILGIETSCDETGASVYDCFENKIISNELYSQIKIHSDFGGVMPEVASRSHVEKIGPIVQKAIYAAKINLDQLDLIGVTTHPGLAGSLLVGTCFAKSVAFAKGIKILSVNHNHGHVVSSFLDSERKLKKDIKFPHLSLSVSGGHTSLFLVNSPTDFELVGQTIDDAAGEAFDKVAKLLGLGYPGGPIVEKLAKEVEFKKFFNYPINKDKKSLDFSFSGLKTAVLYSLVKIKAYDLKEKRKTKLLTEKIKKEVCSSFLVCVKKIFIQKLKAAMEKFPQVSAISLVGGVSCNKYLVKEVGAFCREKGKDFFYPEREFTTDNGAMIALAANFLKDEGKGSSLELDILR